MAARVLVGSPTDAGDAEMLTSAMEGGDAPAAVFTGMPCVDPLRDSARAIRAEAAFDPERYGRRLRSSSINAQSILRR